MVVINLYLFVYLSYYRFTNPNTFHFILLETDIYNAKFHVSTCDLLTKRIEFINVNTIVSNTQILLLMLLFLFMRFFYIVNTIFDNNVFVFFKKKKNKNK